MGAVKPVADLKYERELFADGYRRVAGIDEVGRGSFAGPVSVGVAVLEAGVHLQVGGLTDSKALTARQREAMVPRIRRWCTAKVGHVAAVEIDEIGMAYALGLAAQRALVALARQGELPDAVLLDGKHNWFSEQSKSGLSCTANAKRVRYDELVQQLWGEAGGSVWSGGVRTVVNGDYWCASIAAASVVAKVERDRIMSTLDTKYPVYGWASNKGYGSVHHREAIRVHGLSPQHRLSWSLGASERQIREAYGQRGIEIRG